MSLKILFLSHVFAPGIGGIESSSMLLATSFVKAGHQVRLLTEQPGTSEPVEFSVIRQPSLAESFRQHAWADVVFESNPCLRLGWPKLLFGKPSVIILHTWLTDAEGRITLATRLKKIWLAKANKVIAISTAVKQQCWPSAIIIGNAYDDNTFKLLPAKRQQSFVFLGRLVSDKGADLAIRAFAKLLDTNSSVASATLTIIGEGPDRLELEALVSCLLPLERVRFIGVLKGKQLAQELNRHSYQFIPSTWREPFGIVALEGIACGLIPIVADGGGLPYAVGDAGVVFHRGELDSLVQVTSSLLQSPEQQQRCRYAAAAHLAAFSPAIITRQVVAAVESVSYP
jgi:glycosyltransferase involved in cell wall biosynthesis